MTAKATPVRLLWLPDVVERTGLSATTIWRLQKVDDFPARRRIVGNLVGWRSDDVEAWIESRAVVEVERSDVGKVTR